MCFKKIYKMRPVFFQTVTTEIKQFLKSRKTIRKKKKILQTFYLKITKC